MHKPFFSIIIPVYNTEEYIDQCLQYCINQTFLDIEILIVNDCSQDNSMSIVEYYAEIDSRISIINNSRNLGLFKTRIEGEKIATGKYILHIDSDDWIDKNTCQILHKHLKETMTDILGFNGKKIPKGGYIKSPIKNKIKFKKEEKSSFLPYWTIWNKTYKKELIQKANDFLMQFVSKALHLNMAEDALKYFAILLFAQSYDGIKDILYFYRQNPLSISRNFLSLKSNQKRIADIKNILKILDKMSKDNLFKKNQQNENLRKQFVSILTKQYHDNLYVFFRSKSRKKGFLIYPKYLIRAFICTQNLKQKFKTLLYILIYFISLGFVKI